jgi:hypothetical protein
MLYKIAKQCVCVCVGQYEHYMRYMRCAARVQATATDLWQPGVAQGQLTAHSTNTQHREAAPRESKNGK